MSKNIDHDIARLGKTPGLLGTVHDLARFMNLDVRRVQQLAQAGIIAKASRGEYDLVRCLSMYVAHLAEWRSPATIPCSIDDLSHYFGLTKGQVTHLIRQGAIPPPLSHGNFDLAAAIRGFVSFVHKRGFVRFYGQGCIDFPEGKGQAQAGSHEL